MRVLTMLALAAMVACGDSSGPETPSMAGTWTATSQTSNGVQFVIGLNLTQADRAISGSGSLTLPDGTLVSALTVTGTHTYPQVGMTMTSTGFEPMIFQGEFSNASTVRGQIDGSGFVATAINFSRQ
jgi:hypothetical protein